MFHYPVARFRSRDGREIEFEGLGADPPDYREGDHVSVLYRADRPHSARIESFQELHAGPIVVGAFGLIFAAVGFVLWRQDV